MLGFGLGNASELLTDLVHIQQLEGRLKFVKQSKLDINPEESFFGRVPKGRFSQNVCARNYRLLDGVCVHNEILPARHLF